MHISFADLFLEVKNPKLVLKLGDNISIRFKGTTSCNGRQVFHLEGIREREVLIFLIEIIFM